MRPVKHRGPGDRSWPTLHGRALAKLAEDSGLKSQPNSAKVAHVCSCRRGICLGPQLLPVSIKSQT